MKRTILISIVFALFVSCGDSASKLTSKSLKQEITDTLLKYSNFSERLVRDDGSKYVVYVRDVNKDKIGIVAITDSVLFLMKHLNNTWSQIDRIKFETYATSFVVVDLNGDNIEDLIVHGFGNAHGQSKPFVFMCDTGGDFHYRSDLHRLYNIRFNKKTSLIESFYTGGANRQEFKETYTWDKDSLILVLGVEHQNMTTTIYKNINGQRIDVKKIRDEDGEIYEKQLFSY